MVILVSRDVIRTIARESCQKLIDSRNLAYHTLREGSDLPGLWPSLYVYPDFTWSIGYDIEPAQPRYAAMIMAERFSQSSLADAIERNLLAGYQVSEPITTLHTPEVDQEEPVKERAKVKGRPRKAKKARG